MRGDAMKRVVQKLEGQGIDLGARVTLEFFAREGDWQTLAYADKVQSLEAWEIDQAFEEGLRKNLPKATIRLGDSFHMAGEAGNREKFSFIVFDNPQVTYGPDDKFCEHFEALEQVPHLAQDDVIVIFNVNRSPFEYDKHPQWQQRRNSFYGKEETAALSPEFLLKFYKIFFAGRGFQIIDQFIEDRNSEYLSYMTFHLKRRM